MTAFVLRRVFQAVPQLFIISLLLFGLMQAFGDPLATLGGRTPPRAADRERLSRLLGLDQPVWMQYAFWLVGNDWFLVDRDGDGVGETPGGRRGVLRGDWGASLVTRKPVMEDIAERLPNTLLLGLVGEAVIIVGSLAIGIYSALNRYTFIDNVITALSFAGFSMPVFWLALMLMYIFAVNFRRWGLPYLPTVGMFDPDIGPTFTEVLLHMVLPVTTLSLISIAGYSRYVRSSMLDVLGQDYIRTAKAKGLPALKVLRKHALQNAALPFVTLIGLDLPFLLAGATVTESIFAWPGMGRLFLERTDRSDYPTLMAILMLISVAVVFFQLVTDLVYSFLDPRIRLD